MDVGLEEGFVDDLQQQQQQQMCGGKKMYRDEESIPSIDGVEITVLHNRSATKPEKTESESLDNAIDALQRDLKNITKKIEDYNFSQSKLERELGLSAGNNKMGKEEEESKKSKKAKKEEEVVEADKATSLPLLGAPQGFTLSPGSVDEMDHHKYLNYARQNTNVSTDNVYTRQSTVMTNDTLLTESLVDASYKQKADEKSKKIDL